MCSGQNSLGKGGLNAKAGFCYPYNNRYISFLPSDDTEIFISRNVKAKRREFIECDFLPLIPDGTMYEINQYPEYVDLNIVLTRKD